ncbi:MAG TPA: exosortase [Deltaproteobacteria bacterium]|nr:exosortase [Deltaproteobacteria bacterium]HCY09663.1 exosortase [Deltaproteobacteria bacterium]
MALNRVPLAIVGFVLAGAYYPVLSYMILQWYSDPNYSHGFIVPVVSGYMLYQNRVALKEVILSPSAWGLPVIVIGLLAFLAGYLGTEYFTMRVSFLIVLAGIILFLFGKMAFKAVSMPFGYLFFMVPLPYIVYDAVAFPLKLMVAKYSVLFLQAVGVVVWRDGNIIMFPNIELEVADACSGMRSLFSLLALAVALAYFTQKTGFKRLILALTAIPIAIAANSIRVITTGILAKHFGSKAAEGFFHEFAGLAVFAMAFAMLVAVGVLLRKAGKDDKQA